MATQDGSIPIGELEEGDKVLAYNENTGETAEYEITAIGEHTDSVTFLTIDGEVIETTHDHPFYTQENGWTEVDDLTVGYHIRRADGSYGVVEAASTTILNQPMFNLTVDTAHTFFVGNGAWLVHNNRCFVKKRLGDLEPLHEPGMNETTQNELRRLSDRELLNSVENPEDGDYLTVYEGSNTLIDGNTRYYEMIRRMNANPTGVFNPDRLLKVEVLPKKQEMP